MTTTKLRKIGNSYGLILPKATIEALNVAEGDEVTIDHLVDGVKLSVSNAEVDRLMKIAEQLMEENKDVLAALAK